MGALRGNPAHFDVADGQCTVQYAKNEEGGEMLRHEDGVEANHRYAGCSKGQDEMSPAKQLAQLLLHILKLAAARYDVYVKDWLCQTASLESGRKLFSAKQYVHAHRY